MAQRIQTLCDQHLARDEEVDGLTYSLTLRMPGSREQSFDVDLCDVCAKSLVELREWLAEQGRKSGTTTPLTRANRPVLPATPDSTDPKCPLCDFVTTQVDVRAAVNKHMRSAHDSSLDEAAGVALPYVCDKCDRGFSTKAALGAHRAKAKEHR